MVNRETNFNRTYCKKLKVVRDKRKARATRKKQNLHSNNVEAQPLSKKEEKRQKRLDKIYKEFDDKKQSTKNIIKDKHIRRRNRRRSEKNKNNTEMIIDS